MTHPIRWQHFEPATIDAAVRDDRPILMVITTSWCQHSRELMATSLSDPAVVELIDAAFVPVHVDADRRPDINQRFGTGAWPTVAWLTPGGELIAHDNFLTREDLRERLQSVRNAWQQDKQNIKRRIGELWADRDDRAPRSGATLRREMVDDIADAIYERFDHRHGGFGDGIKFPHPEAIDFALVQVQKRDDPRMREVVTLTLDRMRESPLHDTIEGGFFRFSQTADWHRPNYEKLLDQNALILRNYIEAFQVFGEPGYRETAESVLRWMCGVLRDPHAASFAGSQDGDSDYFVADERERSRRQMPPLDRTVYCHGNAIACSSLLKASAVLARPELREQAMAALQFLLDNLYDGREVYHYWDGTYHLPGMLSDQAYLVRALIDASQNTGDTDLLLPAEAIAERTIARNKSPNGGFYDILHDPQSVGSMRRRNRSILDNAAMAESLVRLSYLSRRPEFYQEAVAALEAFANDYREYGYYVAGYGRAVDLIFYEPLLVTIVGTTDDAELLELRRNALSTYVPSRIVQTLDPERDPVLLGRSGLTAETGPIAHLTVGNKPQGIARSPEELLQAIETVERDRRQARHDPSGE